MSTALLDNALSSLFPIPHVITNILIIYLSVRHVRPCLVRIYALHLSFPSLFFAIYSMVASVVQFAGDTTHMRLSTEGRLSAFVDDLTDFFIYFCSYDYRVIAVVLIIITYVSFAEPLWIKHFTARKVNACFFAAHFFTAVCSYISAMSPNQAEIVFVGSPSAKRVGVDWTDYWEAAFEWSTFVAFLVFYVICIRAVYAFKKNQLVMTQVTNRDDQAQLEKQLRAILLYVTPPNLFLLLSTFCTDLFTTFIPPETPVYNQICEAKTHFFNTFLEARLFIASFTLLLTFADYRKAFLAVFCKKGWSIVRGQYTSSWF
ncbi:hypothetical protein QR680_006078 [Steinernema hermaphroditum]|uniref:Uncharacterized protein n=1 Tax=Steinernema hermaphroditum TaxID=289476 RepID=A0AA39LWH4_9BILA|nr:hypothetical protein QR680_006078 [Steinernema hermaphroditum]